MEYAQMNAQQLEEAAQGSFASDMGLSAMDESKSARSARLSSLTKRHRCIGVFARSKDPGAVDPRTLPYALL
jgi:hypothetical protein